MKPTFTLHTTEGQNTLVVSGDLVVKHSEEFKLQLLTLLGSHNVLGLSLQEVTAIDASALQLVYAFQHAVHDSKKSVVLLMGPAQPDITALLSNTGTNVFFKTINN